jgi:hypothetical protein
MLLYFANFFCEHAACSPGLAPTRLMREDTVYMSVESCAAYWNCSGEWPQGLIRVEILNLAPTISDVYTRTQRRTGTFFWHLNSY